MNNTHKYPYFSYSGNPNSIGTFAHSHIGTSNNTHKYPYFEGLKTQGSGLKTFANTHKYPYLVILVIGLLVSACSPKIKPVKFTGPYAVTNKVYYDQQDSLAKVLALREPAMLTDSMGLAVPAIGWAV